MYFQKVKSRVALPNRIQFVWALTLFARREAKTRIRHRDWLKFAGEKIRREQVGTVPTFLFVSANKFAKLKIGFRRI